MKRPATVVVGAGPAGIGLLVCAAQRGRLGRWLARGLTLVEQGHEPGRGELGRYDLDSDSLATSFIECVERESPPGPLSALAETTEFQTLAARRDRHVPLAEVAAFQRVLGAAMQRELERRPGCACLLGTRARAVFRLPDGGFAVETVEADGRPARIETDSVVLALGAGQEPEDVLSRRVAGLELRSVADRVALSSQLLSHGGPELPRRDRPLRAVVIGASHSAFSVAWALSRRLPEAAFEEGGIVLLHRRPPRIFYATPQAARDDSYSDFTAEDFCPRTGRVHRLGGLRGDGRELWRRVTGRASPPERRVRLVPIEETAEGFDRAQRLIREADLVVPAFGYRPRTLPVFDEQGQALRLRADLGHDLVGGDGRILLADGRTSLRLFGIGLASGFRPEGEPSFAGQTNGVWLYHNDTGERLLEALEAELGS